MKIIKLSNGFIICEEGEHKPVDWIGNFHYGQKPCDCDSYDKIMASVIPEGK